MAHEIHHAIIDETGINKLVGKADQLRDRPGISQGSPKDKAAAIVLEAVQNAKTRALEGVDDAEPVGKLDLDVVLREVNKALDEKGFGPGASDAGKRMIAERVSENAHQMATEVFAEVAGVSVPGRVING